jgi:serine/threonine-protein kinase
MTPDAEQSSGELLGESGRDLPSPGAIFDGKYRIGRAIGQGAMAVVLEATHLNLEDRVAIKLMLPRVAEDPALVERFMREGRAATKIRSEHVVRVFDVGVTEGHPYLVMEYLEGSDLDHVVATT